MSKNTEKKESKTLKLKRRKFIKIASLTGIAAAAGAYGVYKYSKSDAKAKVVIIGGGCAGISIAARLMRELSNPDVTVIDPSTTHYYQPGFTLIGGGVYQKDDVHKPQEDCMPDDVKWIQDTVTALDPEKRIIQTSESGNQTYDFLVLAPGMELDWNGVEGISKDTLGQGDAHCIYDFEGATKTWQGINKFVEKGGRGIYLDTYTKHKCGGAPKKICLLTEHLSRLKNVRDKIKLDYFTASKELYDVSYYVPRLLEIYKERDISISTDIRLKGIDTASKKVHLEKIAKKTIENKDADGKTSTSLEKTVTPFVEDYDFLHFVPPMTAPKFVLESGLSAKMGSHAAEGWVDVDKYSLIQKQYPNIICLGDVSALPTSKTSAAIRKQVPIAVANLIALMEGKEPKAKYNGYAACPIITDYGHVLLCEFDYDKKPDTSFPFTLLDTSHEQYAAWLLKVYALKPLYFYGMLKGIA